MSSFFFSLEHTPSWNGFMKDRESSNTNFVQTNILPLPFVNLNPSNPNTIYTALKFASEQCVKFNKGVCIVTFDQPLYQKAFNITKTLNSTDPVSNVILILGGFHLLMSYLGKRNK